MRTFSIGQRSVGSGNPPYVIAEIGSNHNGDMDLCRRIIDEAVKAGADAVKFQSWDRHSLIGRAEYARNTQYADKKKHFGSLEAMVTKYALSPAQHREMAEYCSRAGVHFLSSAFSEAEVELLESLNVPCHKLPSMDINNPRLLSAMGQTRKPVLMSTGMSDLGEIERALELLDKAGASTVCILHCISVYPPDPADIHLRNIPMLETAFDRPVGFSDHSVGTAIPLAAVALGACVIEKHFTIDKGLEGWDHAISANPAEMEDIVREGRNIALALGSSVRTVSPAEQKRRRMMRRRILIAHPMQKGQVLSAEDLVFKRPGTGIDPDKENFVVGRRLNRDVDAEHELEWSDMD